jgi:glycerol kinase
MLWADGKEHITDVTNASRTLLMDIKSLEWSPDMLATLHIPAAMLPKIRSSSEVYFTCSGVLQGAQRKGGARATGNRAGSRGAFGRVWPDGGFLWRRGTSLGHYSK